MADWWKDVWKEPVGSKAWRQAREDEWPTEEELRRDLEEELQKYGGEDERSAEPDNKSRFDQDVAEYRQRLERGDHPGQIETELTGSDRGDNPRADAYADKVYEQAHDEYVLAQIQQRQQERSEQPLPDVQSIPEPWKGHPSPSSFQEAYAKYAHSDIGPKAEVPATPGVPDAPER